MRLSERLLRSCAGLLGFGHEGPIMSKRKVPDVLRGDRPVRFFIMQILVPGIISQYFWRYESCITDAAGEQI